MVGVDPSAKNALPIVLVVVITAWVAVLLFFPSAAASSRGPGDITLYGGVQGNVFFPHAQHQERIKDCGACHGVFPQETDAIQKMVAAGKLKAKKVMNTQCIKCHRAEKRAGNPHGPLTCNTCHQK